jgi:hypothetical protein
MTNDQLKTEVGTTTGMCMNCIQINVRTELKGTLVSCITFAIMTAVSKHVYVSKVMMLIAYNGYL